MIPEGLKIGDIFTETSVDNKVFKSKVVGFDGQGRYIAEFLEMVKPEEMADITAEAFTEKDVTPIEQMLAEEKPAPKKAPAKKSAPRRKKK